MPKEFQCSLCPCSYEWKTGLQKHFRQKHNGQVQKKEFQCSCGREFGSRQSIENHLKKVDGWQCTICFHGCHSTDDQFHCSSSPTLERVNEEKSETEEEELQSGLEDEQEQQQPPVSIFPPIGPIDDEMLEYSQGGYSYDHNVALMDCGEYFNIHTG